MKLLLLSRSAELYSTKSLLRAARKRGHRAYVADYTRINTALRGNGVELYYRNQRLRNPDAVIGRISPTYTPLAAAVLTHLAAAGATVVPGPTGLLLARNKWRAHTAMLGAGVPIPDSAMLNDARQFEELTELLGGFPLVLKLLESTHGAGVIIARDAQSGRSILDAMASLHQGVMLQEYIAESHGEDVRVLVVDGEIVAAMRRIPGAGEFRSNLHLGGHGERVELTAEERAVAVRAADCVNLGIAGVDLLRSERGPLVMEVNASPGLEGIERVSGVDVAGVMIEHLARLTANTPVPRV